MSGIFGFLHNDGCVMNNESNIKSMQAWNHAYGKGNDNNIVNPNFGLGCCCEELFESAVHINPVLQKNNTYAVIDALLYNRNELIEKCKIQDSISDEELLFEYITQFGIDALKDVNGDFSGAIIDNSNKTLLLFRDHMGIRPLFYYTSNEFIGFSTDIRGLTALPQADSSIREEWIYKTIAGYININENSTEFEHIYCVRPAGYIELSFPNGRLVKKEKAYWQLKKNRIHFSSESDYRNKLRELITDAVKIRLDAVPGLMGAELSGGLDSGVIDILIHRLGRECVYFSWSVDPDELPLAENDERLVIADICEQENITCHFGKIRIDLDNNCNIAESMRQAGIELTEEPPALCYAFPPYINTLTICEASQFINRSGARVVFTGHGGDEGVSHRSNPYEMFYNREYYHFFRYMWSTTNGHKNRIMETFKKCSCTLGKTRQMLKQPFHMPFSAPELLRADFTNKYLRKEMPSSTFAYDSQKYIKEGGSRNRLDNIALLGAYSGVRYLVPYLDYRVVDFAVSIPRYLYLKGRRDRYIFREAFKDIMPKSLYSLRYKEDNSRKNMVKNPNWYEEFAKRKADAVSGLNREYWKQYLNFDVIDEWMKQGQPSEEERPHSENILSCLFQCAMLDNLINRSRKV